MSINGEITAVHISRKSSLQSESDRYDRNDDVEGEEAKHHKHKFRPKNGDRPRRGHSPAPRDKTTKKEQLLRADSDQIDLEKLLHSVLDINDFESRINLTNGKGKKQRPFSAHQLSSSKYNDDLVDADEKRSVMPERKSARPQSAHISPNSACQNNRTNYSFSNDTVDKIDRENQRLLKEIMRNQAKNSSSRQAAVKKLEPVRVKSASALNRSRFQMQVERENLVCVIMLSQQDLSSQGAFCVTATPRNTATKNEFTTKKTIDLLFYNCYNRFGYCFAERSTPIAPINVLPWC